jgi:protein ImuB
MICCLVSESDAAKPGALAEIARACSPRIESHGDRVVVFDAGGLARVIGSPRQIASEVAALAVEQGLMVRIALAPTLVAAWLMAHAQIGQTVVEPPRMAAMLGALPLSVLATLPSTRRHPSSPVVTSRHLSTNALDAFDRWGLKTLSDVAKLPRHDVHARLGDEGVVLHKAACGEDVSPLVPAGAAPEFLERMVLEWPIEGLEPLTFVLSRLCEALSVSLERADRGAVTVTTRLKLVNRTVHERTLNLPSPMRDAKVLRTLVVLDLESNPPAAAIDEVSVECGVAPGRIVQGSLLDRALPTPEELATLTARLRALAGESRVGAPTLLDTHDERVIAQRPFNVEEAGPSGPARRSGVGHRGPASDGERGIGGTKSPDLRMVLRRYRLPVPARVVVERGGPVRVIPSSAAIPSGEIVNRAGPWRSSGRWWSSDRTKWDRDEWDVELAGGGCYRIARDRATGQWEIEGEMD